MAAEMEEFVVLIDESNHVTGTAPKTSVHHSATPLHRGFSVFLFNPLGQVLLQQRSHRKKTWPLVWSNSCCGHPALGESSVDAARRRLKFELGIDEALIYELSPEYRLRAVRGGIAENEICSVLVAFSKQNPKINKDEVRAIGWVRWSDFIKELQVAPKRYSRWCVEEALLLDESDLFLALRARHSIL